jgi:hypothetical protein
VRASAEHMLPARISFQEVSPSVFLMTAYKTGLLHSEPTLDDAARIFKKS